MVKNGYIMITSANCKIIPATGTGAIQTSCNGTIYDSGGDLNYQNNTSGQITINPGQPVLLTFTAFNMESGNDLLVVYDGPTISSPVLVTLTGTTLPSSITTSGALTLQQISNGTTQSSGFVCQWSCATGLNPIGSNSDQILLFPNPASQKVDVLYNYAGTKQLSVVVYDLLGNMVYKENGSFTDKYHNKLDVSSFNDGVYLLQITDQQTTIYKKLTVTK
jgi:hypothetical protein